MNVPAIVEGALRYLLSLQPGDDDLALIALLLGMAVGWAITELPHRTPEDEPPVREPARAPEHRTPQQPRPPG